jgi:hypothetical protein
MPSDRHQVHAGTEHLDRGGLGRSTVQLSEKRLAVLFVVCPLRQEDQPHGVLPKMSHAGWMVGTTRSRVNFFMNKFRKLGFIKYNGGLQINTSLLSVVLHE